MKYINNNIRKARNSLYKRIKKKAFNINYNPKNKYNQSNSNLDTNNNNNTDDKNIINLTKP